MSARSKAPVALGRSLPFGCPSEAPRASEHLRRKERPRRAGRAYECYNNDEDLRSGRAEGQLAVLKARTWETILARVAASLDVRFYLGSHVI
eukprot:6196750-Pleurochrysis_carterae.AAC.5